MRTILTHIDIDAPETVVWDLLTDLPAYPDWNPHVTNAVGDLRPGGTLDIRVRREGVRDRDMTVTVADLDPGRRLAWVGTFGSPWLFEARHAFELETLDGNRTRLHNREDVSGLLGRFAVTDDPERDYEAMNRALKSRAERVALAAAR